MELTPENVLAVMKEHFATVSDEEFAANVAAASGKGKSGSKRDRAEKVRPPAKTSNKVAK